MRNHATSLLITAIVLAVACGPGAGRDQSTLDREIESALVRAGESGALPKSGSIRISSPAKIHHELGVVVDGRSSSGQGMPILAVTPDSAAARAHLLPGDRLIAINDRRLDGGAGAYESLQQALDAGAGQARLEWLRSGKRMTASVDADTVTVPGYDLAIQVPPSGCGFVSDQQGVVPKSKGIHNLLITRIDGRSTPLEPLYEYKLPAGRHLLTLAQRFEPQFLTDRQRKSIQLSERVAHIRAYKTLTVEVKPNTAYRIGARLLKDKLDDASIRNFAYWEPVVWEERAQKCR